MNCKMVWKKTLLLFIATVTMVGTVDLQAADEIKVGVLSTAGDHWVRKHAMRTRAS